MTIFLIEMSVSGRDHDYSELWGKMRGMGAMACFDAIWLLETQESLQTVTSALSSSCREGDGLVIVELAAKTRWSGTGLSDEVQAWIAERTVGGKLVVEPP